MSVLAKIDDFFETTTTAVLRSYFKDHGVTTRSVRRWEVWTFRRGCWRFDGTYPLARHARRQYSFRKRSGLQTEMRRIRFE